MNLQRFAAAAGLTLATTALAHAKDAEPRPLGHGWSDELIGVFFIEVDEQLVPREQDEVEAAWAALDEDERDMLRIDCAAAMEVGAQVPPEGSATGNVADLPEVPPVDESVRNELESDEAAAEGATPTGEPLQTAGPQRRALLTETVPAETWFDLCEIATALD